VKFKTLAKPLYNMKKKILILLLGTLTLSFRYASAQLSVSYYSSSLSKVAIAYNFNPKIWTELRIYSNKIIDDFTPELVFCYNIVNKEKHNIYIGAGLNINYYNGVVTPIGVQFSPFEKLSNFSLHIEIQPCFDFEKDMVIQSAWGIRYTFGN